MEKLRKNAQEFILITLLKLITVDETGHRRVGRRREELSFHGIFCNIYLGVGVPMSACFRVCCLFQVKGVRNMEDSWGKVV